MLDFEEKQFVNEFINTLKEIRDEFIKHNKRMARIEYKMTYGDEDMSKIEDKDGYIKNLPKAYQ